MVCYVLPRTPKRVVEVSLDASMDRSIVTKCVNAIGKGGGSLRELNMLRVKCTKHSRGELLTDLPRPGSPRPRVPLLVSGGLQASSHINKYTAHRL